jgi:hypothetical protein
MFFLGHPIKHRVPHRMFSRQMVFFSNSRNCWSGESDLPTYITYGFCKLLKVTLQSLSGLVNHNESLGNCISIILQWPRLNYKSACVITKGNSIKTPCKNRHYIYMTILIINLYPVHKIVQSNTQINSKVVQCSSNAVHFPSLSSH